VAQLGSAVALGATGRRFESYHSDQYKKDMSHSFSVILKTTGAKCNLSCDYCFYLEKEQLYPKSAFRFLPNLLEEYTKQYIESQPTQQVSFDWQGGEPTLLGLSFFEKAVEYQNKYKKPNQSVVNSFQTNGILLDKDWCLFFKKHNFLVGLSIDGPATYHDNHRVDKKNNVTHTQVEQAFYLLKEHDVATNILCCVNKTNVKFPVETYQYFKSIGAKFIQFIPIVNKRTKVFTEDSISGEDFGNFLKLIFDEWYKNDVGEVFVFIFEHYLSKLVTGFSGLCIFEPTCGTALALEHNGDLYSCDHFVNKENLLGNIFEEPLAKLAGKQEQVQFGLDKATLPEKCINCDVKFICNGGCPKNRDSTGLNYLCDGYYNFFSFAKKPLLELARKLNIM
tara:strand:- start:31 stop:1209 length:1179 start_codon:yes stop_codon:yes gene_type:complete